MAAACDAGILCLAEKQKPLAALVCPQKPVLVMIQLIDLLLAVSLACKKSSTLFDVKWIDVAWC